MYYIYIHTDLFSRNFRLKWLRQTAYYKHAAIKEPTLQRCSLAELLVISEN